MLFNPNPQSGYMKCAVIVGARPNFMKAAPLIRELGRKGIEAFLIHTGQHYDREMSRLFFEELSLPEPDVYLGVGSGTHGVQTGMMLPRIEKALLGERPGLTVVVGDVNSTLAGALASVKLKIPVAHVEAGYRSGDMSMPEEINRIVVDHISSLLFAPTERASRNLAREGIPRGKIHLAGNIMIETLLKNLDKAGKSGIMEALGVREKGYGLVTLHREENTNNKRRLRGILEALRDMDFPLIFPLHPGTRKRMEGYGLMDIADGLRTVQPLGYLDFLRMESKARLILTDSGGVQEEALALGVPCLTLRYNTERVETLEAGGNILVGAEREKILEHAGRILDGRDFERRMRDCKIPRYWDRGVSERIVERIISFKREA